MKKTQDGKHKQAPVMENGQIAFYVDERLKTLIQFLFDMGIQTWNSCQNNVGGTCWIEYDLEDWIMISEIAFRSESQALYRFIEEGCDVQLLSCDDGGPDDEDNWIEGQSLIWSASVRFPRKFIPQFETLVRSTMTEFQAKNTSDSK